MTKHVTEACRDECLAGLGRAWWTWYADTGSVGVGGGRARHRANQGLLSTPAQLPVVSVVRDVESQLLPNVGAIVTCKVCSINSRFAKVRILYIGSTPLKSTFRGTIRREDSTRSVGCCLLVSAQRLAATLFPAHAVEVYKSFRPGDIVLAKVISLGDMQSNYLLSTAENELGVVVAHSEAVAQMVPISWCEMQCPKTHSKELRKVARVQPEFLQT
nr:exosome complex component CSL4 [Pelodiscus sinensis]|eukprot:XP_014433887.1 exosome complex component CSL4 [Pelodiscus sinensis]